MSKFLALATLMCFVLCACGKVSDASVPFVTEDTVEIFLDKKTYLDNTTEPEIAFEFTGAAANCGIYKQRTTLHSDVETERIVRFNGTDYRVTYVSTEVPDGGSVNTFNRGYDNYANKAENIEVMFLKGTNTIANIVDFDAYHGIDKANFSTEELQNISEAFINDFYGKEAFAKYSFESGEYTDMLECWVVTYRRMFNGYRTDDYIWLWINNNGEVVNCRAWDMGKFDNVNKNITKEHIDAAVEIAKSKFDAAQMGYVGETEDHTYELTTNENGEIFVIIPVLVSGEFEYVYNTYVKVG